MELSQFIFIVPWTEENSSKYGNLLDENDVPREIYSVLKSTSDLPCPLELLSARFSGMPWQ